MTVTETAIDPAELLARLDGWLCVLAKRYSERAKMLPSELHHVLRCDIVLHAHQYDPARGKPTTWAGWRIRAVMSELARDRQVEACHGRRQQWGDVADELALGREPDPADVASAQEVRQAIDRRLARLSDRTRQVVAMRYGLTADGREHSKREIAATLGITVHEVGKRLDTAREHLIRSKKLKLLAVEV